jgi:hypothetical protein
MQRIILKRRIMPNPDDSSNQHRFFRPQSLVYPQGRQRKEGTEGTNRETKRDSHED